ncbi:MAG: rhomboid family intramembrane serine protease [Flavobacteriales bacterium]|nr:rhomboid family intramembrane serine protease [Flavobacteriales bacterium]
MTNEIQHNNNSYFTIPLYFVLLLWIIKWAEYKFGFDLGFLGVKPHDIYGLKGILFSPLIHGDTGHLFNNSIPLFVLSMALFYFYKPIAWRVLLLSWLFSGLATWLIGRENTYHIGASGIIYAMASFLFFSGVIRKHPKLMAISLIVTFLYGSMVWGIFPNEVRISWEGHLSGALVGLLLAVIFRKIGPRKKIYHWEEEKELSEDEKYLEDLALRAGENYSEKQDKEEETNVEKAINTTGNDSINKPVIYHYKPKKEE